MKFEDLRRQFAPPVFEDEEQTRLAALLQVVLVAMIGGLVLLSLLLPIVIPNRTSGSTINAVLLVVAVGNLLLTRRGYARQAAILFAFSLWVLLTLAAFTMSGVESNAYAGYLIVIIFVGLLIGRKAAYIFAGMSFIFGWLMLQADYAHVLPPPAYTESSTATFVIYSVYFLVAAALLHVASTSIQYGLARARRGESDLAQRNRELQEEINERKRIEKALRASDTQLRLALEAARMRAWYWDIQADQMRIADNEIPDLAMPASAIITNFETWLTGLHPDDMARTREVINRAVEEDAPYITEFRKRLPDGDYTWIESIGKVWRDEAGKALSMVGVSHNISDRKEGEQHRLELAVQKERLAFLTEFMSNMSHDLRTPLTVLKTSMYLVERLDDPEKIQQRLKIMQSQVELVERYIEDILTISRLDYSPELSLESADFNRLVEEAEVRMRSTAEKKALTLSLDLDSTIPRIQVDVRQIDHILMNLIENACNYTPEQGQVMIRTHAEDSQFVLDVQDTGIGIPEADVPLIFDRFYRGGNARMTHKAGTGLGLAIVKKIVEMHQGTIELDSVVGEGTTFTVRTPT